MKILLINTENTLVCFGTRMISAYLKHHGFEVEILFLPREFNDLETFQEIEEISNWVVNRDADLIGFSLMSSHLIRVIPIHSAIRERVKTPIIWGGIHPSIQPEACIQYADMVCIGEGEQPMLELVQTLSIGSDPSSISSIWVRTNDTIYRNPARVRTDNLDDYPYPDHDFKTHWIRSDKLIRPMNWDVWRHYIPGFMDTHYVMSSRGCPHNCSYCCNSALRKITDGPYLRRRSPEHFIGEMVEVKKLVPNLKGFVFMDDSFFYGDQTWFDEFCLQYREQIDLPFFCWANPVAVTENRIRSLADVGLVGVHVGLESGSPRVSTEVFHRNVPNESFFQCMDILHRHRHIITDIRVDVITDNPYETEDDTAKTIDVLSRLKKPFFLGIVSLIFYPHTELERRATQDGIIDPQKLYHQEFFHYRPTLLNRIMRSVPLTPGWLIRFFVQYRKTLWGRGLFYLYYFGYFVAVRRRLRAIHRTITLFCFRKYERHFNPRKIVTTRVSLIDF